jgi:hypothetical protein
MYPSLTRFSFAFLLTSGSALAATYTVQSTADLIDVNPGNGICSVINPPASPVCTLRAAVMEANASPNADVIILPGVQTYALTRAGMNEANAVTGDLDINQPVTIVSTGRATIDAQGLDRVFHVVGASGVSLISLDIINGVYADGSGRFGSGMQVENSTVTMRNVRVYDNTSEGIEVSNGSQVEIIDSEIFNSGLNGVRVLGSDISILRSAIFNNIKLGVFVQQASGLAQLIHSTVSGNGEGGVLAAFDSHTNIFYSTVADNGFRGISVGATSSAGLRGAVIVGNVGGGCLIEGGGLSYSSEYSFYDESCNTGEVGPGNIIGTTAFISPLGRHGGSTRNHRPLSNSPLIDRIPSGVSCGAEPFATDQRGLARPVSYSNVPDRCDMGSVELETDVIFADSNEYF